MEPTSNHTAFEVTLHIKGNLTDFLSKHFRGAGTVSLLQPSTAKDVIEAMGIPHVEVGTILLQQTEVSFSYLLQQTTQLDIYPFSATTLKETNSILRPPLNWPPRFILDVHLGSLARLLRLAGFDTYYESNADDATIAQIAAREDRIVLTRDIGLLKHKIINWGYWLRSQHRDEQFKEVATRFDLWSSFRPFSHCLACNGKINKISKEEVLTSLPLNAALYFDTFYQCQQCQRVYWKGSHYDRMIETLERIRNLRAA